MLSINLGGIKYHFLSLWHNSTGIEPRSPGPLVNTLPRRKCISLQDSNDNVEEVAVAIRWANKKWLKLKMTRSRQYRTESKTDTDYLDDLALLAYTPDLDESLLISLEQAAGSIGFYANVNKTEFLCFKQVEAIYSLNGETLKLDNHFGYFSSNISSYENDVSIHLTIYTNPSARAGYDTRSIFKRSLTGFNSEFSFSLTSCRTKTEEPSPPYYLPIAGGRIIGFIPFPRVLVLCEMQSVSSRIWTRVTVSISYDDNHYTTGTS